jgi:hypothetical protein
MQHVETKRSRDQRVSAICRSVYGNPEYSYFQSQRLAAREMLPHSLGRYSGPPGRASLPILAILFFVFLCISSFASAQLVNGQFFTNGMAISDSPAPRRQVMQ